MSTALELPQDDERCIPETSVSQQLIQSHAAMVVTQLPFPPMPVMVVRGSEESFCSSHDLMAAAISVAFFDTLKSGCKTAEDATKSKQALLLQLQRDIWSICEREGITNEAVEKSYALFQEAYREYMKTYPCSNDIRFQSMDFVDGKNTIVKQATSHLRSMAMMEGANSATVSDSYRDIIKSYCVNMHAYGSPEEEQVDGFGCAET
jgi:hypothetical protein